MNEDPGEGSRVGSGGGDTLTTQMLAPWSREEMDNLCWYPKAKLTPRTLRVSLLSPVPSSGPFCASGSSLCLHRRLAL